MRTFSFTGSQRRPAGSLDRQFIENVLIFLPTENVEYWTGGCIGVDAFVARFLLKHAPAARHCLAWPQDPRTLDKRDEGLLTLPFDHIHTMPLYSNTKQRNQLLVDKADNLIAFPDRPEASAPYSGTWQTIRMARKSNITPDIYLPEARS